MIGRFIGFWRSQATMKYDIKKIPLMQLLIEKAVKTFQELINFNRIHFLETVKGIHIFDVDRMNRTRYDKKFNR